MKKRILSFLIVLLLLVTILPIDISASAATVDNNGVTGNRIVEEARSWHTRTENGKSIYQATYFSEGGTSEYVARRTGYNASVGRNDLSFDCSGFVSRVLNDVGIRVTGSGNNEGTFNKVLYDTYGPNHVSSDAQNYICYYGEDVSNALQKAKNGDLSDLKPGDLLGWKGGSVQFPNSDNHIAIYAGNGEIVHFTGNGFRDETMSASYLASFKYARRLVPNGSTYLSQCTYSSSSDIVEITSDNAWFKALPCSNETAKKYGYTSVSVIESALPVGTTLRTSGLYKNTEGNYWYAATILNGAYAGKSGYIYRGDTKVVYAPQSTLDSAVGGAGTIHVRGWSFDRDELGSAVPIHVYVGGPAGSGAPGYAIDANSYRPDVNNAYPGVGDYHGFDATISVSPRGNQTLYFYAIDVGSELTNPQFATANVTISDPNYTVSYDANGGTGAPGSQTKTHGIILTLSSTEPTRTNGTGYYTVTLNANGGSVSPLSISVAHTIHYYFNCWNTRSDGTGINYAPGGTYTSNASVTLYAKWDEAKSLPYTDLPTPTRDGYIFKGWATSSTATSGVTGNYTPSGDVTLYAIWQKYDGVACGNWGNLTWTLDNNGLLTISGNGAMNGFSSGYSQAWRAYFSQIRSIQIDYGVTSIGGLAFTSLNNLTSVTIPSGLTTIEPAAFYGCNSLTTITIPGGVTSISDSAFSSCNHLQNIYVSDNNGYYCDLDGILFNKNKTTIICLPGGRSGSYTIPSGVAIGERAFTGCSNISSITIPVNITSIPAYSFSGCSNLTDVFYFGTQTQWDSISIGEGNESLSSATIHFASTAAGTWGDLSWVLHKDGQLIISGNGEMDDFYYDSTDAWLSYKDSIKSVVIEFGVTSVSNFAFSECSSLQTVSFPTSVKKLGMGAFFDCSNFKKVVIPSSLTQIGTQAFLRCAFETAGPINSGADYEFGWKTGIAMNAFEDCHDLKQVDIPSGITIIGVRAFHNCTSLESVSIPESVTSIGRISFAGCSKLTDIYFAGSSTQWDTISVGVDNAPLSKATIHYKSGSLKASGTWGDLSWALDANGVLTISGSGEMDDFESTDSIDAWRAYVDQIVVANISDGITSIGNNALSNCSKMEIITIPHSVKRISDFAFFGCVSMKNVLIPDSVSSVGVQAFSATGLTTVTIPDSLTDIERGAFFACISMTSVTIPESIKSIGGGCFQWCYSLSDVYYHGTKAQWEAINIGENNGYLLNATINFSNVSINYDANGGTGAPSNQTKTHDVALTLSSTTPIRDDVSAGSYTVTLEANGGSVSPTSLSAARTTSYRFKNWNTAADGSGTSYVPGASYTENADVTLYAQWNSDTTTSAVELPAPARNGYTFKGWATSSTASSGVTGSYTPSGNVTLYAVWEIVVPEIASGTWGDLNWILDDAGLLTISGSGPMEDSLDHDTSYAWLAYWDAIVSVVIEPGVTSIEHSAFTYCSALESITIPNSVTSIGHDAFSNCSSLTSVTIPDSVTELGDCAFQDCSGLRSVQLPAGITAILHHSFLRCRSLESVTIPDGVTNIERSAFSGCSVLTSVAIPVSVTNIAAGAFQNCVNLTDIYYAGSLTQWINITIGSSNTYLKNATVHYSDATASGTWGDLSWTLVDGTLTISGSGAMAELDHDTSDAWLAHKGAIVSVVIEPGVTSIEHSAFSHCGALKSITIPNGVTSIGHDAFSNCSSLTSVTIPDSVTELGDCAFQDCSGLRSVQLPAGITAILHHSFLRCRSLESVTIPDGVTNIESSAFSGCSALTSVAIPVSVTNIAAGAFQNCVGLTDIYYAGSLTQWINITIGSSNAYLKNAAVHFADSNIIYDFILPDALTTIEEESFANCAFQYVSLSDKTVSIGWHAFANCPMLKYIYIPNTTKQIDDYAFEGVTELIILGESNSTAESYAQSHGYSFWALS